VLPQTFLKTFWRLELRPQVFVAMSFAPSYTARFKGVIEPAIRAITIDGVNLVPYRVDLPRTRDSILTDIMDGIAHSQLVLADVSSVGRDGKTKHPYRNGNVMYEVGVALACRQPSEVLLVRDDDDRFLFDVSSIPHLRLDFSDPRTATATLHAELMARLRERSLTRDARVELALAGLSNEEAMMLETIASYPEGSVFGRPNTSSVDFFAMASIPRLLDKQLIRLMGQFEEGHPAYTATPLGRVVVELVQRGLRKFKADLKPKASQTA